MADLDTRGLASGFAQGFGLMNGYQQQQRQNERADKRLDMQEQKFGLQMETAEMEKEQVQRQREQEQLKLTLGKIAQFGPEAVSNEERDLLKRRPDIWPSMDQQADPAIQRAIEVFDPKTSIDANDPESLEQANLLFQDMINKGDGGQKRIVGWVPGPDGESVMLELEVTRPDGSTYRAPMTEGRGAEEDAIVKPVKVEDLVNHIQGLRMMRNGFNLAGPEAQQRASQMLQILRGEPSERWETVQGPDGAVFQREVNSGKLDSVIGRRSSSSNYWNRPTATQKDIEYLVANGMARDREEAWEKLQRSGRDAYDRGQDELGYLQDRVSELETIRDSREWQGMSEQQRQEVTSQLEQLRDQRDQVASQLYDTGGGRQPAPQGGQRYPQEGDMVGNPEPSQPRSAAPSAAVEYLRSNDTPEIREQFRAKYGYLPEGF